MSDPLSHVSRVDPELLPVFDILGRAPEINLQLLPVIREKGDALFETLGRSPVAHIIETITGSAGDLDILWFDPHPGRTDRPALLHIHGGGMVAGSAKAMRAFPSSLAADLGIPVASVEYRLAPEHPFPAPQQDCLAALQWVFDNAARLGVSTARLGVVGESAGGGLAAATAQMARDIGGPPLAAQILIFPMLDHRTGSADDPYDNPGVGECIWTRSQNRFGWDCLRGDYGADDARKGWFSPMLADTLADLPPAWIGVGSLDLLFDESLTYARRLSAAGVSVEIRGYAGAPHGFILAEDARVAQIFRSDMLMAARRLLGFHAGE